MGFASRYSAILLIRPEGREAGCLDGVALPIASSRQSQEADPKLENLLAELHPSQKWGSAATDSPEEKADSQVRMMGSTRHTNVPVRATPHDECAKDDWQQLVNPDDAHRH